MIILRCRWHGLAPEPWGSTSRISYWACHKLHMASFPTTDTSLITAGLLVTWSEQRGCLHRDLDPMQRSFLR